MKKSDLKKYQEKDVAELQKEITQNRSKLAELRIKNHQNQLKDTSQITKTKKTIAYLLSLISKKHE